MNLRTTIMIAAYNAAHFLPKSIAAAHAQTGISPDIVVVDDASQDQTSQLMQAYRDVRYFQLSRNGGPSVARNKAIDESEGEWIAVLDADDGMMPDRLATMIRHGVAADADIVLGNFARVDISGTPINGGAFLNPSDIFPTHLLSLEDYIAGNQMTEGEKCLGYLKPLFRRAFLMETRLRYDPALRNSEDYHIIAAALAQGARVIISPEPDYLYQQAEGSLSAIVPPKYIEALLAADAAFAQKVLPTGSETLAALIQNRRDHLEMLYAAETTMRHLKARRIGPALRHMVKEPKARRLVLAKLSEAITKRLPQR